MEIYSSCPTGFSAPWDFQIRLCNGWREASDATSDYLNACSPVANCVNVPRPYYGYQMAHSGNAYCALIAYAQGWYEYIQTDLVYPMIAGHTYNVSFYVSCADYSNVAVNYLGIYFSSQSFVQAGTMPLTVTPQIFPGVYLNDTTNWVLFGATYIAQGGETTLTIGPFPDLNSLDTLTMAAPIEPNYPVSYYFIDDVSVVSTEELNLINVFTPNSDGINDIWVPGILHDSDYIATIYNRWGNEIVSGNLNTFQWDGTKSDTNEMCSDGVYYYVISRRSGESYTNGFIHLIR